MKARDSLHPHAWSNSLPPGSGASAFNLAMRRRLLRSLAQRGSSEVAVFIVPGVLCWVYGRDAPAAPMLVWWASFILLMLVLMALRRRMETEASVPDSVAVPRWERLFGWLALAVGAFWAAPIGIALHPGSSDFRLLLYLTLTAVLASATTFLAPLPGLFWRFFAALYLPLLGGVFWFFPTRWPYLLPLLLAFGAVIARHAAGGRRFVQLQARQERRRMRLAEQYRTAKEQAERALADKNRFIAMASHDLRQPLHAMALFGAVLDKELQQHPQHLNAARLMQAVGALGTSLDAMLDVSRLDAGAITPAVQATPLNALLQSLNQSFAPTAEQRGLQLRLRATPLWVRTDPALLLRQLSNLVDNALKYTAQGGVLLVTRQRGATACIDVRDTGIGIDAAHQAQVFQEFYQVDNASRDRARGLGIGLSIVQRLSLLLGHPVQLRSRAGRGSRFRVIVPLADAPDASSPAAPPPAPGAPWQPAAPLPHRVLLVDDEDAIAQAMAALMQAHGVDLARAANAAQARQLFDAARTAGLPFGALLCDLRLPGGADGLALALQLRQQQTPPLPAVIITGETAPAALQRVRASGLPLLSKPVAATTLLHTLAHIAQAAAEP